jgi:hypothetical protein
VFGFYNLRNLIDFRVVTFEFDVQDGALIQKGLGGSIYL